MNFIHPFIVSWLAGVTLSLWATYADRKRLWPCEWRYWADILLWPVVIPIGIRRWRKRREDLSEARERIRRERDASLLLAEEYEKRGFQEAADGCRRAAGDLAKLRAKIGQQLEDD